MAEVELAMWSMVEAAEVELAMWSRVEAAGEADSYVPAGH